MNKRMNRTLTGIFVVAFCIWTQCILYIDVAPVGPAGTSIGFSTINQAVHESLGVNKIWYYLTEGFGVLAIVILILFCLFLVVQMIKRKGLKNADKQLYFLFAQYVIMGILYLLFEKVIINYRPVLEDGQSFPEASYPSSHAMLVCVVMGSTMLIIGNYIKKQGLLRIIQVLCVIIACITLFGRLASGVHWFSDIIGGALLSAAILTAFAGRISVLDENPKFELQ